MIGIDTNILVRFLTQDDPAQAAQANRLFEETLSPDRPGWLASVVVTETVRVLQRAYGVSREEVLDVLDELLLSDRLVFDERERVARAIALARRTGCGIADALIVAAAHAAGCETVLTFDRGATRAGMEPLV